MKNSILFCSDRAATKVVMILSSRPAKSLEVESTC